MASMTFSITYDCQNNGRGFSQIFSINFRLPSIKMKPRSIFAVINKTQVESHLSNQKKVFVTTPSGSELPEVLQSQFSELLEIVKKLF